MSNRWFRFVIASLAIAAAGAAGYRIFQHEQQLASGAASTRATEYAAESAITTISEIKAALHAYVAAGQARDVWVARASMLIEKLRGSFAELERAASSSGSSLTAAEFDLSDRLTAAEKRARTHVNAGQMLLAGEVIFTEARDLLDGMRVGIAGRRDAMVQAADRRAGEIRREQALLALGAAAVMVMAVLVLVPPGRVGALSAPESHTAAAAARDSVDPSAPVAPTFDGRPKVRVGSIPPVAPDPIAPEHLAAPEHRTTPDAPAAPLAPGLPLTEAAAVCTDLGRVSQSNEISALLGRAANVLSASGVIVWVASENRDELYAAAASGYDERLFERIGSIKRDASNLTAASFRGGSPRTSPSRGGSPAALAVPLLTPQGPVGVFSAELREVSEVDPDRLALAAIFAAQLANLLGSISASVETVAETQAQNG